MKKIIIFSIAIILLTTQSAYAKMYECKYMLNGSYVTSTFNSLNRSHPNYKAMKYALDSNNCTPLIIKKYFLDGTSCNIQLYQKNHQVAGLSCAGYKTTTIEKLKKIAREKYGYYGK